MGLVQGANKRILIFNVNWLGDVLFSTAAIRNIRRNFPGSFLACVIPSRCYPVLKGNPYLDEVIIFDEKDRHRSLFSKLSFIRLLKAKRFDTVFLLHRSATRALICRLAGIKQRIGYHTPKNALLLSKAIAQPKKDSLHRIDYYLNLIEQAGIKVEDRFTDFYFSAEDELKVEEFLLKNSLSKDDFLVVINPGGNWPPKRWPKSYWVELADQLIKRYAAKVILSGAASDVSLAAEIKKQLFGKAIIAAGVFNIKQFAALSKAASLVISADTGPLHIANACGAKIIALFGPTALEVTAPYPLKNVAILQKDLGCKIPCYNLKCKDNRCMKAITPEEVLETVQRVSRGSR